MNTGTKSTNVARRVQYAAWSQRREGGAPKAGQASRARKFVLSLAATLALVIVALASLPGDVVPEGFGLTVSLLMMAAGLLGARNLGRRLVPEIPLPVGLVVVATVVKMAWGLWFWHTFMYSLSDQSVRPSLSADPIFVERRADTLVLEELMELFDEGGVRYYAEDEAYLSINRRAPAHLVAIVIRPLGREFAAYFPFVALVTAFGAIAMSVALYQRGLRGRTLSTGYALLAGWPFAMDICNVTKDGALVGAVMIGAALLLLSDASERVPWGVVLCGITLPLFRTAYLAVALVLAAAALMRARRRVIGSLAGFVVLVLLSAAMERLDMDEEVRSHIGIEWSSSRVLDLPIVGRVVYSLATPFPWTQLTDVWWHYPFVFAFATQVIILAMLINIIPALFRLGGLQRADLGVLLAATMMLGGIVSPVIQPQYVQVGAVAAVPFALRMSRGVFARSLVISLATFLVGNVVWIWIR